MGSGAKSYMRKGFLIYEEMRKYLTINEEAVIVIYDFAPDPILKALTDHFGGGSRVVSFDPYS